MPRKRTLGVLAALAVAVPAAIVHAAGLSLAAAAPAAGGVYTLVPGASGKCVQAPSTASGALLAQAACAAGNTAQQWKAITAGNGYFLTNVASGLCADVPSGATTNNLQLQQYACGSPQTNRVWNFTASTAAPGKYRVTNAATGLCLSTRDGSTAGNNPIVQETCADTARMQIAVNPVGGAPSTSPPAAGTPTVAKDGTGRYSTVQAAVDAAANNSVITIKAGTYREIVTIPATKPGLTLRGLGTSASQVVIVNNHSSAGGYGTSGSATVFVNGPDFRAVNLTMANDYGEGSQAVAANLNGDRGVYDNVRFLGNQDTLLVNRNRHYVVNSYVEGTVDFIFGSGTAVFHNSAIHQRRSTGGPITAARTDPAVAYGFLIYRSTVTGATDNTTQLGRPWGPDAQVLYRESTLSATIRTAEPWTDMSGNVWENARFREYRNTGAGATVNGNRPQLSDAEAATYTPQRYLAGTDGWNPI
ncbi:MULTISPECIES: pectinesterase family protein [Catenuloplanes]|uniref:Pectinesterase n=1 Tax=Catenuloplanes niger TaxID=587534 RepID=A0AAE4CXH4_9ACTN|nr:pectinesterase family protein [Catenuloplanes niger]MDR7326608.1 pectinesterase [Catenuloplanes niger]